MKTNTPTSALRTLVSMAILTLGACSGENPSLNFQSEENQGIAGDTRADNPPLPVDDEILQLRPAPNPARNAYFGDLHVHTTYSFDAYVFGTLTTPDQAYRYAQGEALQHPSGYQVQLQQPLDFYAVTDHAMFLGLARNAADTSSRFSEYDIAKPLHNINATDNMDEWSIVDRGNVFTSFVPAALAGVNDGSIDQDLVYGISKSAWRDIVDAADKANVPGQFTAFVAYEYTSSTDDRGNLHRNVIFRDSNKLPAKPFSRLNSQNPEGLWDWMDQLRDQGIESLAIPHNSNGSNGQMFKLVDWAGNPLDDDYIQQRSRNEPLVEITQVKGTSDTHPSLSKNDEWADFEIAPYRVATKLASDPSGSYVRDAYLKGLDYEQQGQLNPYKFGLVGASDTHTGAISDREETYFSKAGLLDGTPELRGSVPASPLFGTLYRFFSPESLAEVEGESYLELSSFERWSASGIAGVWAEENTREAIYDAFRRKETFATSGPRIKLRFFAGYGLDDLQLDSEELVSLAYAQGTTMGGNLEAANIEAPNSQQPGFLIWALADAQAQPLQRVQVIKGFMTADGPQEQVYDVACSAGEVDPDNHRCPDNGATVDLTSCATQPGQGAAELKTLWQDPDFDPVQKAFYYLRALENPSCRWSTWDALRNGVEPRADLQSLIQERAWSSPIWYLPSDQ